MKSSENLRISDDFKENKTWLIRFNLLNIGRENLRTISYLELPLLYSFFIA